MNKSSILIKILVIVVLAATISFHNQISNVINAIQMLVWKRILPFLVVQRLFPFMLIQQNLNKRFISHLIALIVILILQVQTFILIPPVEIMHFQNIMDHGQDFRKAIRHWMQIILPVHEIIILLNRNHVLTAILKWAITSAQIIPW